MSGASADLPPEADDRIPLVGPETVKLTRHRRVSSLKSHLQTIEEECNKTTGTPSGEASDTPSQLSLREEDPPREVPPEVMEYVDRIREAIQNQCDASARQRCQAGGEESHTAKPEMAQTAEIATGDSTVMLNEKVQAGLTTLSVGRRTVFTFFSTKPSLKRTPQNPEVGKTGSRLLIRATKVGRVEYVPNAARSNSVPLEAYCDSDSDGEAGICHCPLEAPVDDAEDERDFLLKRQNSLGGAQHQRYDLLTGRTVENNSVKQQAALVAATTFRNVTRGIGAVKEKAAILRQRQQRSGQWSKIED